MIDVALVSPPPRSLNGSSVGLYSLLPPTPSLQGNSDGFCLTASHLMNTLTDSHGHSWDQWLKKKEKKDIQPSFKDTKKFNCRLFARASLPLLKIKEALQQYAANTACSLASKSFTAGDETCSVGLCKDCPTCVLLCTVQKNYAVHIFISMLSVNRVTLEGNALQLLIVLGAILQIPLEDPVTSKMQGMKHRQRGERQHLGTFILFTGACGEKNNGHRC